MWYCSESGAVSLHKSSYLAPWGVRSAGGAHLQGVHFLLSPSCLFLLSSG